MTSKQACPQASRGFGGRSKVGKDHAPPRGEYTRPSRTRQLARNIQHRIRRDPRASKRLRSEMIDPDLIHPEACGGKAVDEVGLAVLTNVIILAVILPAQF